MPRIFIPCSAAFRSACAWLRSDSACSRSRCGNGVVLVQVLRAGVVLVRQAVGVGGLQIGVQQLRVIGAAHFQHRLARFHMLARAPPESGSPVRRPA